MLGQMIDITELHDTTNAERFAELYGDMLRYIEEFKCFAIYNGKYWRIDKSNNEIMSYSKKIARSFYHDAKDCPDDKISDTYAKHAKQSNSLSRRQAMVELLKSEPGISVSINKFDTDIFYLNCRNGIVDLRTGELLEHDPRYMITKFCDVDYKKDLLFEMWSKFLSSIFDGSESMIEFVQRSLGMSCTGDVSNQAVFLPYGRGWNGKSTLLHSVQSAVGPDYTAEVDPSIFMDGKDSGGPNEGLASLYKKRLVISTETKQGQSLSTDLIKRMTGGEQLPHNEKYQHQFMFTPEFKLWLSGNHRANISDTTDSIWLRLKQIPFELDFRPGNNGYDPNLKISLSVPEAKEAILSWLVSGAYKWYQDGKQLKEPDIVITATQEYRRDQDLILDFLTENCVIGRDYEIVANELWKAYVSYCKENEKYQLAQRSFYERLREKGFKIRIGHSNKKYFMGIRLLKENEEPDPEMVKQVNLGYAFSESNIHEGIYVKVREKCVTICNPDSKMLNHQAQMEMVKRVKQVKVGDVLPDCEICKRNEWQLEPDGAYYVCPCGEKIQAEVELK